ncbi:MAG TPA: MFS transporter, partial [Salinisphaeraceae bacterium]|nr:MFS transporter [Salinisphaeraceae bacterium]
MNERRSHAAKIQLQDWFQRKVEQPAAAFAGGGARLRVIVLLACTLALDSADKAMIGAIAVTLKQGMNIGNLQLALLIAVPTLVTALATLPFGALADRVNRIVILAGGVLSWAVLMAISGAASSYLMLLLTRLVLGALIAVAIPVTASLIGDYFQPGERARIWGYILAGELAGVAIGYLIAGNIAVMISWRASFWALAALSLVLAPLLWRLLPEPARGGQSQIPAAAAPAAGEGHVPGQEARAADNGSAEDEVEAYVAEFGVRPHAELVLRRDPATMGWRHAVHYILSIRTNIVLISASALGYLFFGALLTFGIVFMRNRFALGQVAATTLSVGLGTGAIIGVLVSGSLADWLIERGRINARVVVSAVAFLLTVVFFLPALL